jgi:hypothetical protein
MIFALGLKVELGSLPQKNFFLVLFFYSFSNLPPKNCDSDDTLMEMSNTLKTLRIEKDAIGWDLEEWEQTVRETAADQTSGVYEE